MPDLRIGISGWTYAPWRGVFYPPDLVQKRELEFASRALNSIEINGTFYSLQKPSSFQAWHDQAPADFVFAVKATQYITHRRRLKECAEPLANFLSQGLFVLGKKLGPILWQLPPNLTFDAARVESFLALLPHDGKSAMAVARKHEARMKGRAALDLDPKQPIRHAMEVRHNSFRDEGFVKLLRKHNVALVVADTAGRYPYMEDVTADFVYCRLHGDEELYASGYTMAALDAWAKKIRAWSKGGDAPKAQLVGAPAKKRSGRDVYAYFDNDVKVRSPFDAAALAKRLGVIDAVPKPHASLKEVTEAVRKAWPLADGKPVSAKQRSRLAAKRRIVPR